MSSFSRLKLYIIICCETKNIFLKKKLKVYDTPLRSIRKYYH